MRALFSPTGILVLFLLTWLPAQEQAEGEQAVETKVTPSGEVKIFNDLVISEGEVRSGAIRIIGGNLTVAGKVTGRITVLGGDVELLPTAQVEGTIVALGGTIHRSEEAQVTGEVLEVNRGKISLSREEAKDIFGYDESRDKRIEWRAKDEEHEWETIEVEREKPLWQPYDRRRIQPDFEIPPDKVRYNRAEGLAIYVPFHPDTDDIPGFHLQGVVGYTFGANTWYGRLGLGEYFWRGRIGLLVEGHKEARNDDSWRVTPKENSLGAFLIHKDWYDWYEAEGWGGSLVLGLPPLVELKARYRNEQHRIMDNGAEWSLFKQDRRFRPAYDISAGKDVNLQYQLSLGRPVGYFPRGIRFNLSYAHTQTLANGGSDFDYAREDVTGEAFIRLHTRLGIRLTGRTGAIEGDNYGLQHQVPLGGLGSVQGYDYKSIFADIDNHYAVINAMFSLRKRDGLFSLHWHYGASWQSDAQLFTSDHFEYPIEHGYHAVGLSASGDDFRIELFRPLREGRDWVFYLRILDF